MQSTLAIAEPALSFLGLGQQAPWLAVAPGAAIFMVVLAFNMFGDGLRDALYPRDR